MIHNIFESDENITLCPLQKDDIEFLRKWRNDKNTTPFLTPLPEITAEMQLQWYNSDCADESVYTFAIKENKTGKLIGSVSLYNISGTTAEFGRFLLSPKVRGNGYGKIGTELALKIGFDKLGFTTIKATVHQNNNAAIIAYLKSGFTIYGYNSPELLIIKECETI